MQFDAPLGVYNSIYGGVTAAGLFANVLGVFPQLTDDSFLTIGLDGPASESAQAGAVNPSFYSSNEPNSTRSFFEVNGGVLGPALEENGFSVYLTEGEQSNIFPDSSSSVNRSSDNWR